MLAERETRTSLSSCPKELPGCFTQLLRPRGLPDAAHVVQDRSLRHLGRLGALEEQSPADALGGQTESAQRSWSTEQLRSLAVVREAAQEIEGSTGWAWPVEQGSVLL